MKFAIAFSLLVLSTVDISAQRWTDVGKKSIEEKGKRDIIPDNYLLVNTKDDVIKSVLWSAPNINETSPKNSPVKLQIVLRNGKTESFKIVEYNTKEPALAAKFPNIKSFIGVSENDPMLTLRADYTVHGLRAVIDNRGAKTYIDHYQRGDKNHKVVYHKHEYSNNESFSCNAFSSKDELKAYESSDVRIGNCVFKEYQLSVSATSGYTGFHGATSAAQANLVMSAIETSINRINGIYEREVATRFILVGNTNLLWFYNYNNDPFGGSAGNTPSVNSTMLNNNLTVTNNTIGSGNYDIGHVYALGDGGIAQTPSICLSGKARGATGRNNPVGDPFDVDYVAHEMGHQFGGNHVQNNACNRNNPTAVEPGSGSTIMGYAGICGPNVDNSSHDNFHVTSLGEMKGWIDGQGCHTVIPWSNNNTPPIVDPVANKTLPISTPFVLNGVANDAEQGTALLYTWDQTDNEVADMPPTANNDDGPAFRARPVSNSPIRYFPQLSDVTSGVTPEWEVLPAVSRTMNFTFTARDSEAGIGGCTSDTDVTLTFSAGSGPFTVLIPNGGEEYMQNSTVSVTWDKAGTDTAPVSCTNVDIILSTDGGLTYPTVLLANTPNDGSADITTPMINSTLCRIMIKCGDNYFFDISNNNFQITDGSGPRCITIKSTDIPVSISAQGTPTITSDLTIRDRGTLTDLNVKDLKGTHTYISDLNFFLQKGSDTGVEILNFEICSSQNNFDINLDDIAASSIYPCPPIDGLTYKPENSLAGFNSNEIKGNWKLTVNDVFNADGGALEEWGLEYCALDLCDLTVNKSTYAGFGSISEAIECAESGDTIWLENLIPGQTIDIGNNNLIINKNISIIADVPVILNSTNSIASIVINNGNTVSLKGFTISNTNNIGIENNGNLTIEDMTIMTNGTTEQIKNVTSAQISINGTCNVKL